MATQTYKRRHINNLKRPQQEANMADKLSQTPTEEKLEPARITIMRCATCKMDKFYRGSDIGDRHIDMAVRLSWWPEVL